MESLFSTEHEPYTLQDIAAATGIPYKRVHYCYSVLKRRASTRDKVHPLDEGRPLQFSAVVADLIARNCHHSRCSEK